MSAITSLRGAIEGVTDEAEDRVIGVLRATEGAFLAFVSAIFVAVEVSVRQVVQVGFGLANTFVSEGFNVADAVITAVLGEVEEEAVDFDEADSAIDPPTDTGSLDVSSGEGS